MSKSFSRAVLAVYAVWFCWACLVGVFWAALIYVAIHFMSKWW